MHKNSLWVGAIALVAVAGCSKPVQYVSVSMPPQETFTKIIARQPATLNSGRMKITDGLESGSERKLLIGSGAREAEYALATARKNQERAYKEALADLKSSLRAIAMAENRVKKAALVERYKSKFDALYLDLRRGFEIHADYVGPRWTRLATLAGFPDKLEGKKAPSSANFIAKQDAIEADKVRLDIRTADAAYRKKVAQQIEDARQEFRAENTDLEAANISHLAASDIAAEQEARKIASEIFKGLESSMVNEIEHIPAYMAAKVEITSPGIGDQIPMEDNGPSWTAAQRMLDRAKLFAQSKGYRLAAPGPGVRDVTAEFLEWDKQWVGR